MQLRRKKRFGWGQGTGDRETLLFHRWLKNFFKKQQKH